jgi:hypothetical protein
VGSSGSSVIQRATSMTVDVSTSPEMVVYERVGCQPAGSLGAFGSKLPVLGWRKMGCPGAVTVHRPKSGSRKTRPTRSEREMAGRRWDLGGGSTG